MNIAFYAPMKSPEHPVPSGDRLMARLLMRALGGAADEVRLASAFRAYARQPESGLCAVRKEAGEREAVRIIAAWQEEGWRPDVWISYHPYYKAPDWLGPRIAARFGCGLVTAEASYAPRRASGPWAEWQRENVSGLRRADGHFYMTERDRVGLAALPDLGGELVHLPPFIDASGVEATGGARDYGGRTRLVTVAMMRADVKLDSYRYLAKALAPLEGLDWTLDIVGDGAARTEVERAFAGFDDGRVTWHGELDWPQVQGVLGAAHLYVWPGFGEAYGLAYLEAQALGLPVVAQASAGVPEVVIDGRSGLLVPENDLAGFSAALARLMGDRDLLARLAGAARAFVMAERTLASAEARLAAALPRFAK